jgi:hypothetical protein
MNKQINKTGHVGTYNRILRLVRVTIVVVVKQEVLYTMSACVYSCLSHPACKSRNPPPPPPAVLYYHPRPVCFHHVFPILIKGTFFEKKIYILNIKCVFFFSITFVCKISHCVENLARYYCNCRLVFM